MKATPGLKPAAVAKSSSKPAPRASNTAAPKTKQEGATPQKTAPPAAVQKTEQKATGAKQGAGTQSTQVPVKNAKAVNLKPVMEKGNQSSVKWVDEKAAMNTTARKYNDSAAGARSNTQTKLGQAPSLQYTDKSSKICTVRFDGLDGSVLIDRKVSIVMTDKAKNQALRQSEALKQNSLKGRWEVPNVSQETRALKMLKDLKITNIEVRIVNVEKPN
jgi:hypothetical protein